MRFILILLKFSGSALPRLALLFQFLTKLYVVRFILILLKFSSSALPRLALLFQFLINFMLCVLFWFKKFSSSALPRLALFFQFFLLNFMLWILFLFCKNFPARRYAPRSFLTQIYVVRVILFCKNFSGSALPRLALMIDTISYLSNRFCVRFLVEIVKKPRRFAPRN